MSRLFLTQFADPFFKGYNVHAVDINEGDGLKGLSCTTSKLDVTSEENIQKFKQEYGDGPLDLLLNVAGIMDPAHDALSTVTEDSLARVFAVNTFGPLLLTQAFLANILKSSSATTRLGFVSSRVGSISDNSSGGNYAYRSSKTALNMICKNLAVELKDEGVVVSILHPGIVRTNIAGGEGLLAKEAVDPDEAAEKLFKVLSGKSMLDTGKFWHREGYELPW